MTNPTKFSWTDPTTNTDGSAVSAGEITGYTIGIGTVSGTYTQLQPITPGTAVSEALSQVTPPLKAGTYFAAVRAESAGGSSAWSTEVQFTLVVTPTAPTGFGIA